MYICALPRWLGIKKRVLDQDQATPARLAFFLVPQFSLMAFSSAIEPLRAANRLAGRQLYEWQLASIDGKPVTASNGIEIAVAGALAELGAAELNGIDMVTVCAGLEPMQFSGNAALHERLRWLARHGCRIGAISTGSFILAEADLLSGRRSTVHWEYLDLFRSHFPKLDVSEELYVIDGNVFTCSGGTAALDMFLQFVDDRSGPELAIGVAEQFIHPRIRKQDDHQRMTLHTRLGLGHPKLVDAIRLMEAALDTPRDIQVIAREIGLSSRQLERLFQRHLGLAPATFYLRLRLDRSRTLLRQTTRSVLDVALECGFGSSSHFSKAYRRAFDRAPSEDRLFPELPRAVRAGVPG
jgi:transcriptional regulator GlxA family with amidase domain